MTSARHLFRSFSSTTPVYISYKPKLMLSLPENLLDKALAILVEGIIGLDYESIDRATPLNLLSQKVETLEFVLQAFDSHVRKRIPPIRRQINELLPISKLPDELLQQIFLIARDVGYSVQRYRAPTRLAAVSWRWRSVSTSYAKLWSSLHSDLGVEATKLMLQRSKSAPLDLICSCKSKVKAKAFFNLLTPLTMRWRSLKFTDDHVDGLSLDFLAEQSFPLLESLTLPDLVEDESPDDNLNHYNLDIIAPLLRELEAIRHPLPLRLDQGTPSMLTTLSFTAAIDGIPFLPIDYHVLLTSTPHLQHLAIKGYANEILQEPDVAAPLQIDLPHLDTLDLDELSYKTIGFLISSIVTPSNRYPEVEVGYELYDSLSAMFSLPPVENSLIAGFSRGDRATLFVFASGLGVSIELGGGKEKRELLRLRPSDSVSPTEDLSIVTTMLLSGIKNLEVHGLSILQLGLGERFHLLPQLEKIRVRSSLLDRYADCRALEQVISLIASRSSPNQSSPAICPLLRHIVLDTFDFNLDCLLQLVVARTAERDGEFQNEGRLQLVELGEKFDLDDPTLKVLLGLAKERQFELHVGKLLDSD
ncbi:hypothetical protein FRC02_004069 [Tulasnella sp. 418]|nr:hypothetical protein FRC02_004069 [Tulasnella sp. 418]